MSSTDPLYLVFLFTGFAVGFGHCIGMCGPIVVSLSLALKNRGMMPPHLFYNAGRITTYGLLGGIMGLTGSFVGVTAPIAGIQKGVMIFAGILIMAMGLAMSGWIPMGILFGKGAAAGGMVRKGFRRLTASKSGLRYYPLGLLLGLLPCGPVYTALIAAARAGMEAKSATEGLLRGTALMLAFGLGTVPALLLVAKLSRMNWLKSRAVIYKISAFLMMGVGVYFVIKGIRY
jgi:sulfite exporter TauE/SafE